MLMNLVELPIEQLEEAPWNPNRMDEVMLSRLNESIQRFGLVGNLVVRRMLDGNYEVLSGNQRLQVLRDINYSHVPCVVLELNDAEAKLLAQALNRIEGDDDLGLKAELVKEILKTLPQREVLSILPESMDSLEALASLGQESLADQLNAWQKAQKARLHHLTLQLTSEQLELVEGALNRARLDNATENLGPNRRGTALTDICRQYLRSNQGEEL